MTELLGINADRVSAFSWMLSSFIAGLAGVLIAPLFAEILVRDFTTLLVAAIAAAAFGAAHEHPAGARSVGCCSGSSRASSPATCPPGSILASGLRPSLPFVLLFLLLLFWPGLRRRTEITDPLAGVDPPPPGLAAAIAAAASRSPRGWSVGSSSWRLSSSRLVRARRLLARHRHQGGRLRGDLPVDHRDHGHGRPDLAVPGDVRRGRRRSPPRSSSTRLRACPVLIAMVARRGARPPSVGALLAIPVLRLGGIYLALATLAFALMFDSVLVPLDWVGGGRGPARRALDPGSSTDDHAFFLFCRRRPRGRRRRSSC